MLLVLLLPSPTSLKPRFSFTCSRVRSAYTCINVLKLIVHVMPISRACVEILGVRGRGQDPLVPREEVCLLRDTTKGKVYGGHSMRMFVLMSAYFATMYKYSASLRLPFIDAIIKLIVMSIRVPCSSSVTCRGCNQRSRNDNDDHSVKRTIMWSA